MLSAFWQWVAAAYGETIRAIPSALKQLLFPHAYWSKYGSTLDIEEKKGARNFFVSAYAVAVFFDATTSFFFDRPAMLPDVIGPILIAVVLTLLSYPIMFWFGRRRVSIDDASILIGSWIAASYMLTAIFNAILQYTLFLTGTLPYAAFKELTDDGRVEIALYNNQLWYALAPHLILALVLNTLQIRSLLVGARVMFGVHWVRTLLGFVVMIVLAFLGYLYFLFSDLAAS